VPVFLCLPAGCCGPLRAPAGIPEWESARLSHHPFRLWLLKNPWTAMVLDRSSFGIVPFLRQVFDPLQSPYRICFSL